MSLGVIVFHHFREFPGELAEMLLGANVFQGFQDLRQPGPGQFPRELQVPELGVPWETGIS